MVRAGRAGGSPAVPGLPILAALVTVTVLAGALLLPGALAAQTPPPDASWRSLDTPHFRITFPAGMDALARRTGEAAEAARGRLADALVEPPEGRIELVLTDHADVSNGFAGVAPYPHVTIFARPPVDGFALSHFEDWIELVVTHELAHVVHLDVVGGPGRLFRALFGRVPGAWPFFPGFATPTWVVEGLATWYESHLTGSGRVEGTFFDMVLRTAALEGRLETVDQASGSSPAWPSGQRPYAYGSAFFAWLLERYGEERMADFVEAVGSQWIPYRLNAAARGAFGVSFSDAWDTWRAERIAEATALARAAGERRPDPPLEELTRGARQGLYARVGPEGTLAYARADGRSDPQIRLRPEDGRARGIRTNGLATFDWAPDGALVLAQLEIEDLYRLRSDLYRSESDGSTRRITRGERLDQPSVAPDGVVAWAVQTLPGRTRLVQVELASGRVEPLAGLPPDADWGFPAVAADGRSIAAVRWTRGEGADLVLLDARDGTLLRRITDDAALELAPAWAPDGTLLWISDRTGIPNLYALPPEALRAGAATAASAPDQVRQVTDVATGVGFPSVDPEGRWIHLSVYHAEGWEVARLPYRPATWTEPQPAAERFARRSAERRGPERRDLTEATDGSSPSGARPSAGARTAAGTGSGRAEDAVPSGAQEAQASGAQAQTSDVRPYRPWPTLRPRYWEPLVLTEVSAGGRQVLGPFLGFRSSAEDAVGRHAFAVSAAFSTTGGHPAGGLAWIYRGLGSPELALSASQGWDAAGPFLGGEGEDEQLLFLRERERRAGLDLSFPFRRWRWSAVASAGAGLVREDRTLLDERLDETDAFRLLRPTSTLADLRTSLSFSRARRHDLSISPEAGSSLLLRVRRRHELDLPDSLAGVPSGDRGFDEGVGRARLYTSFRGPGFANHVLAFEAVGGVARGAGADGSHFDVGGASGLPEPFTGYDLFGGGPLLFPVRGYGGSARSGRYAWSASAEWRFPLGLVNRGLGLLPLHLDRLHGALFADAGNAWGPELDLPGWNSPRRATLVGAGGELRAELLTLFTIPLTIRVGAAAPLVEGDGVRVYVRFGSAF